TCVISSRRPFPTGWRPILRWMKSCSFTACRAWRRIKRCNGWREMQTDVPTETAVAYKRYTRFLTENVPSEVRFPGDVLRYVPQDFRHTNRLLAPTQQQEKEYCPHSSPNRCAPKRGKARCHLKQQALPKG